MAHAVSDIERNGLRARLVHPEQPNRAGVLVLSAWPGIDERIEEVSERLAGAGFTALAWDPFSAYDPAISMPQRRELTRGAILDTTARQEQVFWLDYMQSELGLERLGVIGFCMGGRMGLTLAAIDRRLQACVAFYPTIRLPVPEYALKAVDEARNIECAVQVHYPGRDEATNRDTFLQLRHSLESRSGLAETFAHYYPHADHGFLSPEHQSPANAAARQAAWPLTMAFFHSQLQAVAEPAHA
ncbi:MAG TPA: dienelactone hydrolase family protein [Chloroflexota bacterium]